MEWQAPDGIGLWQAALAVIPLVIVCGAICRLLPLRAATRHTLWVATLLALILPALLPSAPRIAASMGLNAVSENAKEVAVEPVRPIQPRMSLGDASKKDGAVNSSPAPAVAARREHYSVADPAREFAEGPNVLSEQIPPASARRLESPKTPSVCDIPAPTTPREITKPSSPVAAPVEQNLEPAKTPPARQLDPLDRGAAEQREAWLLAWRATLATWFVAWIEAARWLRDGIVRLPAVPPQIWASGIALGLILQSIRVARFRRRLRRAVPAPAAVLRSVDNVVRALGMRGAPRTLLLEERVSPLIWCGRRPTLILPLELWRNLDKRGRTAILAHELAHLRRRDHWVCWLEQAVALVYWWHPLVWWIRKRIHEEADLSCDAWVTWLMPQGRRAYAEALLKAKQFVGSAKTDVPAGGMAAASGRAREFARRLTMVMTQSARPRRSLTGIVCAAAIVAMGWIAAPAWSCPPEEQGQGATKTYSKNKEKTKTFTTADGKQTVVSVNGDGKECVTVTTDGNCAKAGAAGTYVIAKDGQVTTIAPAQSGATTTDQMGVKFHVPTVRFQPADGGTMVDLAPVVPSPAISAYSLPLALSAGDYLPLALMNGGGGSDDERLARLEAQLEQLRAQVAELNAARGKGSARSPRAFGGQIAPVPATPPTLPTPPTPPAAPLAPQARRGGNWDYTFTPAPAAQAGPETSRTYTLPPAKLESLYALMARDDVPVRVSRSGNQITVFGNPGQQETFARFVALINPGGQGGGADGDKPARTPKVKKMRAGGQGGAELPDQQRFDEKALEEALAQVKALDGKPEEAARRMKARAELWAAAARNGSQAARESVQRVRERLNAVAAERKAELEQYSKMVDSISEQAEKRAAEAEALRAQAEEASGQSEAEAKDRAKTLERQARDLEAKMRELEKQAREWERKANKAEHEADQVDDSVNELNEMLEAPDADTDDAPETPAAVSETVDA